MSGNNQISSQNLYWLNTISILIENLSIYLVVFNVINKRSVLIYCTEYPNASVALQEWYYEISRKSFSTFNELKMSYGNASLVGDDRVVFNISGNHYRLVVRIVFDFKTIQIKWFGSHAEYDKIDVLKIKFKKKK